MSDYRKHGAISDTVAQAMGALKTRPLRKLCALIFVVFLIMETTRHAGPIRHLEFQSGSSFSSIKSDLSSHGSFDEVSLPGYLNHGLSNMSTCNKLRFNDTISVQKSFYLEDDLVQIARSLDNHPMVDYQGQNQDLSFVEIVDKTWARMSGSSVWLEQYKVYLSVTRVIFFDKGVRRWPVMSFLRAQIYDENWVHQENFTLNWQGEGITFPRVFFVPAQYETGGGFYGPEDPRVIIENDVENAEPVVVFNMLTNYTRAMYVLRPFSNHTSLLKFEDKADGPLTEKNWAPFFHKEKNVAVTDTRKWPNRYMHFVYSFQPLRIIRCHLFNGFCKMIYEAQVSEDFKQSHKHDDPHGSMRGGTNFVAVPKTQKQQIEDPNISTYVGLPRTHTSTGCKKESMYRPEIMVLTGNGSDFRIDFVSEPLDFGTAILEPTALADPCGKGQIMIPNSIARWETSSWADDLLTLTLSVDDSTVQVMRMQGLLRVVQSLPGVVQGHRDNMEQDPPSLDWTAVGSEVMDCSVQAASNYAIRVADEAEQQHMEEGGSPA